VSRVEVAYTATVGVTIHVPTSPARLRTNPNIPAIITSTPRRRRRIPMAAPVPNLQLGCFNNIDLSNYYITLFIIK
jgi:hypothetical protein